MGIYLDHTQQFGFPGSRDRSRSARGCAPWHGIQSSRQETFEHTLHGILTAQHRVGDLTRLLALQREQEHLVTRACFGIGAFPRLDGAAQSASLHPLEAGLGVWSSLVPFFDLPLFFLLLYHSSACITWKHIALAAKCSGC
jgi:hypothetical protein